MKTILVDARNTFFTSEGMFQEMYTLLEQYPNPKIVVTNANDEQLIQFGIDKSPYQFFTLKHNPDKIDPVYFTTLFTELGLSAGSADRFERVENMCIRMSYRIKTKMFIGYYVLHDFDRFLEYYESNKQVRLINPMNKRMMNPQIHRPKISKR